MIVEHKVDETTIKETKLMLASQKKRRPISVSQIMYANVIIKSDVDNKSSLDMGRIPLVFLMWDLKYFIEFKDEKKLSPWRVSDENQNYTIVIESDEDKIVLTLVKYDVSQSIYVVTPSVDNICIIVKDFVDYYVNIVPELKKYTQMKYIKEEFNF